MIEKFGSYEKAAFFVEEKRAEGFHSYIVNESTGFLWGPSTVGGFRVFVSDEPVEGAENLDSLDTPPNMPDSLVSKVIRTIVLIFLGFGILGAIISGLAALETSLSMLIGLIAALAIAILGGYFIFRREFPDRPE